MFYHMHDCVLLSSTVNHEHKFHHSKKHKNFLQKYHLDSGILS